MSFYDRPSNRLIITSLCPCVNLDPDIEIEVDEGVYGPSDDTYLLLESVDVGVNEKVLEVGTGCGIIALHCAKKGASVVATDISDRAVVNATRNSTSNAIVMDVRRSDLTDGLDDKFDVVIFNPPYLDNNVCTKDARLDGGSSGSELSVRFLERVGGVLKSGARIYLLTSSLSSEAVVAKSNELFRVKCLGSRPLFFERLEVLLLTDKD